MPQQLLEMLRGVQAVRALVHSYAFLVYIAEMIEKDARVLREEITIRIRARVVAFHFAIGQVFGGDVGYDVVGVFLGNRLLEEIAAVLGARRRRLE